MTDEEFLKLKEEIDIVSTSLSFLNHDFEELKLELKELKEQAFLLENDNEH